MWSRYNLQNSNALLGFPFIKNQLSNKTKLGNIRARFVIKTVQKKYNET